MNNQRETPPDPSIPPNHVVHRVSRKYGRLVKASRILIIAASGYSILLLATTAGGIAEDKNWGDKQTMGGKRSDTLQAHADPKATPRPPASPPKEGKIDLEKQRIGEMKDEATTPKKNNKGIQQPTVDKTSSKTSTVVASPSQPINVDLEATRVKTEIRKIQTMPISQDGKLKKLQALRDREMAKDHPNKATLDTLKINIAITQSAPSNSKSN